MITVTAQHHSPGPASAAVLSALRALAHSIPLTPYKVGMSRTVHFPEEETEGEVK